MNKILVLACIVAAIVLGVAIAYYLEIPPAPAIVEAAKTQITELTGGIDTNTLIAGGGTALTTAAAGLAVSQFNQKKAAISSAISSSSLAKEAQAQVSDLTKEFDATKTSLTNQTEEYRLAAEKALTEAGAAKSAQSTAEAEVKRLQSQIDGLHELIPDMKDKDLTAIIKKAIRVP